jgi:UrcA family protein
MYRMFIVVAVSALLASTSSAQQRTRIVHYQDLDLASAAGQKQLNHRLRRAVDYVCRMPSPASPLTGSEDQDCRAEVLARVQTRMQAAVGLAQARAASQIAAR